LLSEFADARRVWYEARMGLGEHPVAELEALVVREPHEDRWWELLIVALYRSGRRGAALQAYGRVAAQRAADGLEVEGPLQLIHERVERRDPELHVSTPVNVPAVVRLPSPQQLPADLADFVDRAEVRTLRGLLDVDAGAVVPRIVLAGPPGIGTSALAVHVAHQVRAAYPDGQLYVDLAADREQKDPMDALGEMLRALGLADAALPETVEERAARYRSLLAERRVLVVLDNAAGLGQVRPLLPAAAGCAVLITTHDQMVSLAGASLVRVGPMTAEESASLLRAVVGDVRVDAEPAAVASIVASCAGSPLALRIAGARLASRPSWGLGDYARLLCDSRQRLRELSAGDLQLRRRIAASVEALPPLQARALRAMAWIGSGSCAAWVVSLAVGENCVEALSGLADRLLIQDRGIVGLGRPRYQLDDLARSYCLERAAEREVGDELARLTGGCVALLDRADRHLPRGELYPPAGRVSCPEAPLGREAELLGREAKLVDANPRGWLETEWAVLIEVAEAAARAGQYQQAAALMRRLSPYLDLHGHSGLAEAAWSAVRDAAESAGDAVGAADSACWGAASSVLGHRRRATADLVECVSVFEEYGECGRKAQALVYLAECELALGELAAAREHVEAAAEAAVAAQDEWAEMAASRCLAVVLASCGEEEAALARAESAVKLARRMEQPLYVSGALSGLMRVLHQRGDHERTQVVGRAALEIVSAHEYWYGIARICHQLGEIALRDGLPAHGVGFLTRAAEAYAKAGDPVSAIICRVVLGEAQEAAGDPVASQEQVTAAAREVGEVEPLPCAEELAQLVAGATAGASPAHN
jgi:tetratricopeptide (TPR) repeat protein